jgi:hypothetical protein
MNKVKKDLLKEARFRQIREDVKNRLIDLEQQYLEYNIRHQYLTEEEKVSYRKIASEYGSLKVYII